MRAAGGGRGAVAEGGRERWSGGGGEDGGHWLFVLRLSAG